jgi:hypothetical protein
LILIKGKSKKTAGVARQQLHFLCLVKENESKRKRPEALPCSAGFTALKR